MQALGTRPRARHKQFPPPVRGWVTNEGLALSQGGAARVLKNWFPTQTGIRLRGGLQRYALLNGPVTQMVEYVSGSQRELFATDASGIYNITNVTDPEAVPAPAVNGMTGGAWSFAFMETAGGDFMRGVNGSDPSQVYDGTTWGTGPAITGVNTEDLSQVLVYRSRMFFIEKDSLRVWYLPVDTVGGAALDLSVQGVFTRGGSLMFGGTWSMDAGDGLDDKLVLVSTEGEVAVYEGSDPSDAASWSLVGKYDISRPLGPDATIEAGGDIVVATQDGFVPISEAITKDVAALSLGAVSYPIEPDWQREATKQTGVFWTALKWAEENMALIGVPTLVGESPFCFVVNVETGAWCEYTGWQANCFGTLGTRAFMGREDGRIMRCEVGGMDDEANIEHVYVGHFDHLALPGHVKVPQLMRAIFRHRTPFEPSVGVSVDYDVQLDPQPNASTETTGALWDNAIWDQAVWSDSSAYQIMKDWCSVVGYGCSHAPQVQVTSGGIQRPDVELISIDLTYEAGGLVV